MKIGPLVAFEYRPLTAQKYLPLHPQRFFSFSNVLLVYLPSTYIRSPLYRIFSYFSFFGFL